MKRLVIFLGIMVGLGSMTFAQSKEVKGSKDRKTPKREWKEAKHTPEEIAKVKTERMDKELKFSKKQREQIYALNLQEAVKHQERMDKMRKERELSKDQFKAHREAIAEILTPEQQKLLEEKALTARKERPKRGDRKFEGRPRQHKEKILEENING